MLKTALLILTLGPDGATHMALSEADSLADCVAKAESVGAILTGAGYDIQAMRCGQTDLALTPYQHGRDADDMQWRYRVVVKGASLEDGFTARPVAPGVCRANGDENVFCAVSAQGPATD
ncbi:hypothetical protein D6850_06820 [Roseovarius spongiae]|uniref:Uncharacterized protein n=1 Tax=Roseovarius spongiae TaxID=2320272 RepID=A0A3A8B5B2_9RHOB|nr:hypothetical protein [Roseovarius spongiae]RKF14596.1 hypothetical protein D6850_06820 [Roseovarius spongiae]